MGTPVPFLERVLGAQTSLVLVYPERELVPAAVRAFIDVVTTSAESGWAIPSRRFRAERGSFALERLRHFVTPSGGHCALLQGQTRSGVQATIMG